MHTQREDKMNSNTDDRYVSDLEAAEILGVSRSWLRQLRCKGGGCRFYSFGRTIRYRLNELHEWAETLSFSSTTERAAKR